MSKDVRHIISKLLAESSQFNVNDVLVDAKNDHRGLHFISDFDGSASVSLNLDQFPKRILSDSKRTAKESGVNTLCVAKGALTLTLNGREVQTPILLIPLNAYVNRIQQTVSFHVIEDAAFVNPFLVSHFRDALDLTLPKEFLEATEMEVIEDYLQSNGLEVNAQIRVIGNFHHHRYQVLKELEDLLDSEQLNPAIGHLFGEASASLPELNVGSTNLFPADTDQETVFKTLSYSHIVVQGPPGTGKSQVICNLIGKALSEKQTILAVSEKRAALEVIQSKLGQLHLDILSFVAGSDRQSNDFLLSLKTTWDFFESYVPSTDINLQLSEQYEDHLQMNLDLLNQQDLIGGVSFHEFQSLIQGRQLDSETVSANYSSTAPSIAEFLKHKAVVEGLFSLDLQQSLSFLRKRVIESDQFLMFDQHISTWRDQLSSLQSIFTLESWNDLSLAMKEAATCQIFENELFKKYGEIFRPESKEQKQFSRLAKQYTLLYEGSEIGSEWKTYPSLVEAKSLLQHLTKGTFFERISAKKRWKTLSNLPISEAATSLESRIKSGEKEEKLSKCISQLKKLGVQEPSSEIELIQRSTVTFSSERWETYLSIPVEHRANITKHHKTLNGLFQELNSTFKLEGKTNLSKILGNIGTQLGTILSERKNILQLSEQALESFRSCSDFGSYETLVLESNYTIFKERFPAFSDFNPSEIKHKVTAILAAQSAESITHAGHLLNDVYQRFTAFHQLLNTPTSKLKPEQKVLKKELKKGKSILIKEFGKTRSHPSLRELFLSESRHWISLLKPIWLSNPSSLAKCFPMEQHCFDLVIFDEASQIPLQHALGAVQRGERIVVAGDEHQMGPSNYFQSGSSEIIDLLHQASYYFPKVPLLHHYRSAHPALIAFSNKHFYDGKLSAYPSAHANKEPITHHFIEGATFIDRVNQKEAKEIAQHVSECLKTSKSIGIVAFSEEQLTCIWKQMNAQTQEKLLAHQEANGGFFKALENVQGDECDSLIIGFGYAPNENGDFHLRFGPMNTENGRKRLNVLLTRAKESIAFFCSVRSSDFKLSDNESINLLRQWIAFSELGMGSSDAEFPHGLFPKIDGKTLTFDRIQRNLSVARELATLQGVLEKRGWNVEYS